MGPDLDADDRTVVRDGYDALAATYTAERSPTDIEIDVLDRVVSAITDDATGVTSPRLLDAGCGAGTPVLERIPPSIAAVGLDIARGQLVLAADRAAIDDAALVQGGMETLPLAADSVAAVTAYHSLIHVPADRHATVLAEFARVLCPGGWLAVSEGIDPWTGINEDWLDTGVEMRWQIAGAERTREHLRAAGFEIVDEWVDADDLGDDGSAWRFFLARHDPGAAGG